MNFSSYVETATNRGGNFCHCLLNAFPVLAFEDCEMKELKNCIFRGKIKMAK